MKTYETVVDLLGRPARVEIVPIRGTYSVLTNGCYIFTGTFPECQKFIRNRQTISWELVDSIQAGGVLYKKDGKLQRAIYGPVTA